MKTVTAKIDPTTIRYQLKITLLGVAPPIWRRVEVPGGLTLGRLHGVIQIAMGWEDAHLHEFASSQTRDRTTYVSPRLAKETSIGRDDIDENSVIVAQVLKRKGSKMYYQYDFGDSWNHEIQVEKRFTIAEPDTSIRCLDGQRACPPEDSGGVWRYLDAVDTLKFGTKAEIKKLRKWYGDFDPERFDLGGVQAVFARY